MSLEMEHRESQTELEKAALIINTACRNGEKASKVIDAIRLFPKPILLDWNNVFVNNPTKPDDPLSLNPEAPSALEGFRTIGNRFIITNAANWQTVHDFLISQRLWHPEMVIMTSTNYKFLTTLEPTDPDGIKLRKEFLESTRKQGLQYSEEDLLGPPNSKRIAPIFGKLFPIALIDNSFVATTNNPGIYGITVKTWEENEAKQRIYEEDNKAFPSLTETVNITSALYASLRL